MYIVGEGLQRPQHRDHLWSTVHSMFSKISYNKFRENIASKNNSFEPS
jgi:hypothetical protein